MAERRTARDGLTLIEVVVALAVSAVILSAAGVSLHVVTGHEALTKMVTSETRQVERLRRAMASDLDLMLPGAGAGGLRVEPGTWQGYRADTLSFVTSRSLFAEGDGERPIPRRVVYIGREESGTLTLFRVEGEADRGDLVAVPVLRGLTAFAVEATGLDDNSSRRVERAGPDLLHMRLTFTSGRSHAFTCAAGSPFAFEGGS
jgi:prepilin-type N-terminal cleavage/methylation domain-containing protein